MAEAGELEVAEIANLVRSGRTIGMELRDGGIFLIQAYADNLAKALLASWRPV